MSKVNSESLLYTILYTLAVTFSFIKFGMLASLMSSESFGIYSLSYTAYVYLIYLFSFGANEYVLKKGSLTRYQSIKLLIRDRAILQGTISLSIALVLVMAICLLVLGQEQSKIVALCASLAIVSLPFNIYESYFRTKHNMLAFSSMAFGKGGLVITVIMLSSPSSYEQALFAELFSTLLVVAVAFVLSQKRRGKYVIHPSVLASKRMQQNGYALSLSTMAKNILLVLDKVLVGALLGAAAVGTYTFFMLLFQATLLGTAFIMNVLGPKILVWIRDGHQVRELFKKSLLSIILILLCSALLWFPARWGYTLMVFSWFEKYSQLLDGPFFLTVYISSVVMFCSLLLDWIFIAISREKVIFYISLASTILFLGAFFLGLYFEAQLLSAFIAMLISKVFVLMSQVFYLDFYSRKRSIA